ncbi:MAG: epoxyqueuosine reductase QueH, partial [Patescibacteria group bacterium]
MPNPRLLLHVCCGVCSSYVPELLVPEFDVTVYYENSNLYPSSEFGLRRDAAKAIADRYRLPFIEA